MQRNLILGLAALVLLLGAALAFLLLRDQPRAAPIAINAAEENAVEPLHQEMDCIDRLMQNHNLSANEVQPALARCQGARAETQNLEQ